MKVNNIVASINAQTQQPNAMKTNFKYPLRDARWQAADLFQFDGLDWGMTFEDDPFLG